MPSVELYEVTQRPGDVLYVRGAVDGLMLDATGWVSALENYYAAEAYDADGHLLKDAAPRPMTEAEARVYCEGLLLEAAGVAESVLALPVAVALDPEPDPEPPA